MFNTKTIILAKALRPDLNFASPGAEELVWLKIASRYVSGNPVCDATITNGIATFGGVVASQPLVSLLLNIPVTQTGSGTPSPDNIRDFIGVSGVNIGQTSGYGEYFRGLLNGTYGFVDLGSLTWNTYNHSSGLLFLSNSLVNLRKWGISNLICPKYTTATGSLSNMGNKQIKGDLASSSGNIYVRDNDYSDATTFKTAMQGVYLIYELAEPSTPITPQDFATLCQAFGITGNTYQITFGQTVYSANLDVLTGKLYLPEIIKTIDENSDISMLSSATSIFFDVDPFFDIEEDTESVNCNVYQRGTNRATTQAVLNNNPDYSFCCRLNSSTTRIMIKDTRFTSADDYKTWLSNNPVKIAVKLATPIEIQLTPTVINTLIGDNVIFADVANVTECKYTRK